ncbi:MAG: endonuclease III [Chloroflexi bacterium]|nr:endonuclease III [Chloroflexota bacterium]
MSTSVGDHRRRVTPQTAPAVRLPLILARLDDAYGQPVWQPSGDPLTELIQTILSQHTSDVNSGRAYQSLVAHFPNLAAVRDAPPPLVVDAIRMGGLAEVKTRRIQAVLAALSASGGPPRLPDLTALPLAEARRYLTDLPGVGPKTAACVLMFGLGLPALPVDTHVHRVSRRLGLIPDRMSAEAAHAALEALAPPADAYRLHVDLIRHGRRVCRAPTPRCAVCVVRDLCPTGTPAPTAWSGLVER